jgi:hypothetical protein
VLSKSKILKSIDKAYAMRVKGDKEGIAKFWAKGAKYELVGSAAHLPKVPAGGKKNAVKAVGSLIDIFKFKKIKRLDALVEGNRAAVRWEVQVVVGRRAPVVTELYDLWTFGADGKAKSLVQFADTATLSRLVG